MPRVRAGTPLFREADLIESAEMLVDESSVAMKVCCLVERNLVVARAFEKAEVEG